MCGALCTCNNLSVVKILDIFLKPMFLDCVYPIEQTEVGFIFLLRFYGRDLEYPNKCQILNKVDFPSFISGVSVIAFWGYSGRESQI